MIAVDPEIVSVPAMGHLRAKRCSGISFVVASGLRYGTVKLPAVKRRAVGKLMHTQVEVQLLLAFQSP